MTVESFGVQTVQAVATVILAALMLLGAVLLALGMIAERGVRALVPAIVLSRAVTRHSTHPASFRPHERFAASLPSRAPPQFLHRPDRTPPERRLKAEG
jgi:hypothetical protein